MMLIVTSDYRLRRLHGVPRPVDATRSATAIQIIQSLVAVGSGGLSAGADGGVQKLYYIPEPHTDFIYAVIAEEFGLVGTTVHARVLRVIALARPARVAAGAGSVRRAARARHHDDDRAAGAA